MDAVTQGTLVAERYHLIRQLGFGGMGTVWMAYDEALASQCAVKLLLSEPGRNEELEVRFECEAKCAAQLRSPHVVDVFNRGYWQGKPFIVMEYLEGEDLAARLARARRLDPATTYRIVAQVARALTRAHSVGIIHRDIKPANIFLVPGDEHEIAKVLDFGIAKHGALPNAFESPQGASFIGTPCYMSPEQVRGETGDYRGDLWALAMITFECLTGSLPFPDDSVVQVVRAVAAGDLPSLTANHPELPSALEAWWRCATAKRVDERFQSAKDLADALGEALEAFPRLPISAGSHVDGEANTLFASPDLAPASPGAVISPPRPPSARPVAAEPLGDARGPRAVDVRDEGLSLTLRACEARARRHTRQTKASMRHSLRVPMHSRRALTFAGAAACAVLGFAASSFSAELGLSELGRHWPRVAGLIGEQPEAPRALVTTPAPPVYADGEPKPPEPLLPVALQVSADSPVTPAHPSASVEVRPAPRAAQPAQSRSARVRSEPAVATQASSSSEPTLDLPGELLDPSPADPSAEQVRERIGDAPVNSNAATDLPGRDQVLPRKMPPGEKDYGI